MSQSWWQLDWLWTTTGWLLAGIAAAILLWALFGDRARARKRCPKCWYDMGGLATARPDGAGLLTCPECGRASTQRRLAKTRRRYGRALIGLVVLFGAYAVTRVPEYRSGGWVRLVPSIYLAALAETTHWSPPPSRILIGGVLPPTPPPALPPSELIGEEAWRRVYDGQMWDWQRTWFLKRAIAVEGANWPNVFRFPSRWVDGKPIPVFFNNSPRGSWPKLYVRVGDSRRWIPRGNLSLFEAPLGPAYSVAVRVCFDGSHGPVELPFADHTCRLVPTIGNLIASDNSEALSSTAIKLLRPRIIVDRTGRIRLEMNERAATPDWQATHAGLGCEVDVFVGDLRAGRARFWPNWKEALTQCRSTVAVEWLEGMKRAAEIAPETIRLHITGSLELSFQAYREWPFDDEHPVCWTGAADCTPAIVHENE